jgi:hypothetical protein
MNYYIAHKEDRQNYYLNSKDDRLAYQKKYNMANREKIREYNRMYYFKKYEIKRLKVCKVDNNKIPKESKLTIVKGDFIIHIYE